MMRCVRLSARPWHGLLLILCLAVAGQAAAGIYRWVDDKGKVHFSDKPPHGQKSEAVTPRINTYKSVSYDSALVDTGSKVVMYSTAWCGYCKKARQYFKRKGIAFTEYDIEKNARAKAEYDRMGARGVPVILVGKRRMNGFSEAGFERLYP